jgi:hypothetical protein
MSDGFDELTNEGDEYVLDIEGSTSAIFRHGYSARYGIYTLFISQKWQDEQVMLVGARPFMESTLKPPIRGMRCYFGYVRNTSVVSIPRCIMQMMVILLWLFRI